MAAMPTGLTAHFISDVAPVFPHTDVPPATSPAASRTPSETVFVHLLVLAESTASSFRLSRSDNWTNLLCLRMDSLLIMPRTYFAASGPATDSAISSCIRPTIAAPSSKLDIMLIVSENARPMLALSLYMPRPNLTSYLGSTCPRFLPSILFAVS